MANIYYNIRETQEIEMCDMYLPYLHFKSITYEWEVTCAVEGVAYASTL